MTSPAANSPVKDEVKPHICNRLGCTIDSMVNTPYRQLQYLARMCGVPCNLKKEILKMVIKAKMNGQLDEVEIILKKVRETRLLRKKQKAKALETSKAIAKVAIAEVVEEKNNNMVPKVGQETVRHTNVREMLRNMVQMSSARNVTIKQTSTHTRYRALITPGSWKFNKCVGITPTSTKMTPPKPETISRIRPNCNGNTTGFATPPAGTVVNNPDSYQANLSNNNGSLNHMNAANAAVANQWNNPQFGCSKTNSGQSYLPTTAVSVVANQWNDPQFGCSKTNSGQSYLPTTAVSVVANQWNDPQFGCSKTNSGQSYLPTTAVSVVANQWNDPQFGCSKTNSGQSYLPSTAVSVRETLLQQYQRNPVFYESAKRSVDNSSWKGGMVCHQSNIVAASYQSLPNSHNQPYNHNQLYNNIQSNNSNQVYNNDPQTSELSWCQSKPVSNSYQATQQYERSCYGGFQHGIQKASTPANLDEYFGVAQNTSTKVSMPNLEACTSFQQACPNNRVPLYHGSYQNQVQKFEVIPEEASPGLIDVTNVSAESEGNNVDTDLGLLANMAMAKAQEVIDGSRREQYNNGLLMINGGNTSRPFGKEELTTHESDLLSQDFPTWNHFLEQMSNSLSPGVTNIKVVLCKYGCQTPSYSKQQQLEHEEKCLQQPIQCPMISCRFVTQLGSITTHILNGHSIEIRSGKHGAFVVDFTDGKCTFGNARASLRNCPKRKCFPQIVDGRLFLIKVVGNFDSMQVLVYAQYVNDHYSWRSHIVCEIVRRDGVPYQWSSEVPMLTYSPVHVVTRRKCLIFTMDIRDYSQNLFVVHSKIYNHKY